MEKFKQIAHLRWLRLSLGQTLAVASAKCGVTHVNFALIDGGRLKPTVRDAQKLEAYLTCPSTFDRSSAISHDKQSPNRHDPESICCNESTVAHRNGNERSVSKRANEAAAQTDGAADAFAYRRIDALAEVRSGQISRDTFIVYAEKACCRLFRPGALFLCEPTGPNTRGKHKLN